MTDFRPSRVDMVPVELLKPAAKNARKHSKKQTDLLVRALRRYRIFTPIVKDENNVILAGHNRLLAAKILGMTQVPCISSEDLTEDEKKAFALAENSISLKGEWDVAIRSELLIELTDNGFEILDTGFEPAEVDQFIVDADEASPKAQREDRYPETPTPETAVSRRGDLWILGRHRLVNGDAKDREVLELLMDGQEAAMVFSDPPYNVPIAGHVSGRGRAQHREFAEAYGEMSRPEFVAFLRAAIGPAADACREGSILFLCMDDKHLGDLLEAGYASNLQLLRICVWARTNGGMGTFYRTQTEFVTVWKVGKAPHTNTFGLGEKGRSRTTLWTYAGVNTFKAERMEELALHPTVKPTALVADAIRDVSNRGEVVLDMFGGSGTTLIAAQKTGRAARLVEIDTAYCDVIIQRWQRLTGQSAVLAATGEEFEKVALDRRPVFDATPVKVQEATAVATGGWGVQ